MTDSNGARLGGLTAPGCAVQPNTEHQTTPAELILGSGRGNARMKMHLMALQMLAGGSAPDTKVIMIDPKGGESVETTVGRLLLS